MRFRSVRPSLALFPLALTLSCGGGEPTPNPIPTITVLARDTATAGAAGFALIVGGTEFMSGVVGTFDGTPRSTTRLNNGSLVMTLLTSDLGTSGDHEIRAKNPEPGGGPSDPVAFHVLPQPPVPVLDSVAPDTVVAGSPGFTLHAYGSGYTTRSNLRANGANLTTTFISATHLSTELTAGNIASQGTFAITVYTPPLGGGQSAGRNLIVGPPPPGPAITRVTPDTMEDGLDTIPVTVHGTGFTGTDTMIVTHQGATRRYPPSSVTDSSVTFQLDRTWLTALGFIYYRLHATSGYSNLFETEIRNPFPVITGLSPDTVDGTQVLDTIVVTGTGFLPGLVALVDGGAVAATEFLNGTSLRVVLNGSNLFRGGVRPVVLYDGWELVSSAPVDLAIISPPPVLDSIQFPALDTVGSHDAITVIGKDFRGISVVMIGGVSHTPTFSSATALVVDLLSEDTDSAGTVPVSVKTSGPGGGESDTFSLQIVTPTPVPVVDSILPTAVQSDSGAQTITLRGHGFVPGTVIEAMIGNTDFGPVDTLPILAQDDSVVTVGIPAPRLVAGQRLFVGARAPGITGGPSPRILVPVRTPGIRRITDLAGALTVAWASDTLRGLVYGASHDGGVMTLEARDGTTGAVTKTLPLPPDGARLYIDDPAQYLYVISQGGLSASRIDLAAWHLDWTILAPMISGELRPFLFLVPEAAHPGTFAAAFAGGAEGYANWTRIYDSEVVRAGTEVFPAGVHAGRFFGDTLLLVNGFEIYRRIVAPGVVTVLDTVTLAENVAGPGTIISRTRIVTSNKLLDLTTGATVATNNAFQGAVAYDAALARFYLANLVFGSADHVEVTSFDPLSGASLRQVGFELPFTGFPRSLEFSPAGRLFLGSDTPGARMLETVLTDP